MTNPSWPEIKENLHDGEYPHDRQTDVTATVFTLKVKQLVEDFLKRRILGCVLAYFGAIEYQKRGLPHLHLLLIMRKEDIPDG